MISGFSLCRKISFNMTITVGGGVSISRIHYAINSKVLCLYLLSNSIPLRGQQFANRLWKPCMISHVTCLNKCFLNCNRFIISNCALFIIWFVVFFHLRWPFCIQMSSIVVCFISSSLIRQRFVFSRAVRISKVSKLLSYGLILGSVVCEN